MENINKPEISFDDFLKLDLRVGTILSADDLENSNKLIKLIVDIGGGEKRQIVAGIKKQYKVEDLAGKQVVVIVNLPPKKLGDYESNGMLLASHDADGLPVALFPERQVPDGSNIS